MKLKSYFAGTVEAAMSEASRELGTDAMLVYSREAPPEARYLGTYEVVFALPGREPGSTATPPPAPMAQAGSEAAPASHDDMDSLLTQVSELQRQMARMAGALARNQCLAGSGGWRSEALSEVLEALFASGLSPELLQDAAARLERLPDIDPATAGPEEIQCALREILEGMFSVDPRIGIEAAGARTVALVGPPGSGKTTTLVKLAAAYQLRHRQPPQILSIDMWRVGGAEQLRSYAAILGAGFQALETPRSLAQAIEEHRKKGLVLIDTPGHGEKDMDTAADLAAFLQKNDSIDVHLTLSASTKSADLKHAVGRFERFRTTKLIFTRLDETSSLGDVLNEAIRTGKPISFLTNGQLIPEDLLEASKAQILDSAIGGKSNLLVTPGGDTAPPPPATAWDQPASKHAAAA